MLGQILGPPIAGTVLAGVLASIGALSAGPERPASTPTFAAARQALLAQCMAGSDEIALSAGRDSRQDRLAADSPRRHAVCYAAIVPERDD
jgi:hypothetical protein